MSLHVERLRPDRDALTAAGAAALEQRLDAATLRLAPSFSAAVFDADGVVAWVGRGHQRRDAAVPTRDTIYRIASMSKSFLGAAALVLRDEGRLDMHAPITDYVPEFAAATYRGRPVHVTLDMLMSNRAGLAEDNPWGDDHLGASRAEMSRVLSDGLRLALPPDEAYQYSNLGISLIGRAVEQVTGQTVERFVSERLLRPLGLHHTAYSLDDIETGLGGSSRAAADAAGSPAAATVEGEAPRAASHSPGSSQASAGIDAATGWRSFDSGATWAPEPYVGCGALGCIGALFSTVDDIAAWGRFLRSAFTEHPVREDVLAAASRRELQRVHTIIAGTDERLSNRPLTGAGYGYGLVVEHHRRLGRIVQHSGGLPGFTSHMRWHVDSGVGVVVFGNSDATSAAAIAIDVHDRLLDEVVLRLAADASTGPVVAAAAPDEARPGASDAAGDELAGGAGTGTGADTGSAVRTAGADSATVLSAAGAGAAEGAGASPGGTGASAALSTTTTTTLSAAGAPARSTGVLAGQVRPWPETLAAARTLDAFVCTSTGETSIASCAGLFARNVLTDEPAVVRDRALAEARAAVGGVPTQASPVESRLLEAPTEAVLRWIVPGESGDLVCTVRMVGLSDPLVQAFSVDAAARSGQQGRMAAFGA
ncbi:serine hydrolase domain-containing protein [Pseudoclavibacter sp. 13-3]|uniref:serine hydrolase domain-containing protein n=1 Tax=Pseudoclavibacter sp. 13-3 TaxID=2901228 RepID=UPI001E35E62C|nr:serine hydrolase domain-containing protein [Pseudoclavibacter sp. 13-3]MCD7101261.1 beta-lactamase family protein [Pseudoclavibacter sp. 13-3]